MRYARLARQGPLNAYRRRRRRQLVSAPVPDRCFVLSRKEAFILSVMKSRMWRSEGRAACIAQYRSAKEEKPTTASTSTPTSPPPATPPPTPAYWKSSIDLYYDTIGITEIDRKDDKSAAFAVFQTLAHYKTKYTLKCKSVIGEWQSPYGQFSHPGSGDSLRQELRKGRPSGIENANTLIECGHSITLPSKILFRGTLNEDKDAELFTSTSLSTEVMRSFGTPFVFIFVPDGVVHGLVIQEKRRFRTESEILLLDPVLEECSEEDKTNMFTYTSTKPDSDLKSLFEEAFEEAASRGVDTGTTYSGSTFRFYVYKGTKVRRAETYIGSP